MFVFGDLVGLAALAVASVCFWLNIRKVKAVRVPLRPNVYTAAMITAVALVIAAFVMAAGIVGVVSATGAFILAGFFLFTVATSGLPDKEINVGIDRPCPEFQALDHEARPFRLSGQRGRPTLLIVFRGWW